MKTLNDIFRILKESVDEKMLSNAKDIVQKLKDAGYEHTYFVGGYVRDMVLGLDSAKDIDIATEAKPEEVKKVFAGEKFIEVGESFNIVMIVRDGETFEVATFRTDNYEFGDGRRPSEVTFSNPEEDAKRRDFTVNALFYDPLKNKVIDYIGGQKDIEAKLLRAIGEPAERFNEDFLRMLRAIRFAAQKGFSLEPQTFKAIKDASGNINKISKERIKSEMDKILMSDRPGDALEILWESELLQELFPEIAELKHETQNPEYHPEGAYVERM